MQETKRASLTLKSKSKYVTNELYENLKFILRSGREPIYDIHISNHWKDFEEKYEMGRVYYITVASTSGRIAAALALAAAIARTFGGNLHLSFAPFGHTPCLQLTLLCWQLVPVRNPWCLHSTPSRL